MDELLKLLKDLLPVEIAVLIVIFIYFLKVFKDISNDFVNLAKQQAEYMKERVDSVDKTTGIFERTVNHQEKDLKRLYDINEQMKQELESKKDQTVSRLDEQMNEVVRGIEDIRRDKISSEEMAMFEANLAKAKTDATEEYTQAIKRLSSIKDVALVKTRVPHKAFVVMPFSEGHKETYEAIRNIFAQEGVTVFRADERVTPGGDIATNVRQCIADADVIIVDLTERNPSVMYELGYAHGTGKSVILLTSGTNQVPFDVSNYRVIVYDKTPQGKKVLAESLKKVIVDLRTAAKKQQMKKWLEAALSAIPYTGDIMKLLLRL